jgi:hypothetical protein
LLHVLTAGFGTNRPSMRAGECLFMGESSRLALSH